MREADVLIVGAGPAGAAAAINLAPFRRVVLIDCKATVMPRIGESLVPAARRLLADMRLLESFLDQGHEPWHGRRAVWGGPEPGEVDFLRDPDGHGWHLDRARFERWLRDIAAARGAELLCPAAADTVERDGGKWRVTAKTGNGCVAMTAGLLIDAGGRAAPIVRKLGARAKPADRLLCGWLYGRAKRDFGRGMTYVEAVRDGWWYTAPLPGRRRVLAFHTDADLPPARIVRETDDFLGRAQALEELSSLLAGVGFVPESETGITAAHSAMLEPASSDGWLAVGDAALSFDPLSSRGLLNALFTGLAGAEAADRHLSGDELALIEYRQTIRDIADAYRRELADSYASESRWPNAPFWKRRLPTGDHSGPLSTGGVETTPVNRGR